MVVKKTEFETDEDTNMKDLINIYNEFIGSFNTDLFSSGIIKEIDEDQLKTYLANPDKYQKELEKISQYYYISNESIFQLLNMPKILPTLNYKINSDDKSKQYDKNLNKCDTSLKQIKHKTLTRDIISQLITTGTVVGVWLNGNDNPYFYTFDCLDYIFPAYRRCGEWIAWIDLSYLDSMDEFNKKIFCDSLNPYLTIEMYNKYKESNKVEDKYIELPEERTCILRTNTLKRNQRFGIPWATVGLNSILHKKKLKDMEKNISNKVMNAIAILQLGNKETPNLDINKNAKSKVYSGVKDGLDKNTKTALSVIGIPDWASLEMLEIKNSNIALDSKKFDSINSDISVGIGLSQGLFNGQNSNFASLKLNLEIFNKRVAVLLENIEQELYQKFFNLILPKNVKDKYSLIYDKDIALTKKERIEILTKLHTSEGFSLKALVDEVDGLNFDEYITQSIHELEDLELQNKIKPYQSAYTSNGDTNEANGRPSIEDGDLENESTIRNKENLGNEQ